MPVRILVTGGTFDKEYDEITGELYFKDTHMREILELGRSRLGVKIKTLMLIDSLDMTDSDRSLILEHCKSADEDHIVVTHGTDTMTMTAKVLAEAKLEKTIVLTGAMIPYKFGSSDGLFNVGGALAYAQALPKGVYVAMNGRYFNWDEVQKNKTTGVFEEISR
ncbi:MAG: asparaginase domain-containing protein [Candidatus Marinimicrobia bacterium]|jgi:L-asparaginase|nr:asparaginase domain-containing protein [Candidatus Neomarinimicrobiota bacterium]|tara:strand:+ start:1278 stop:1769 length:492 start_codon:yes stop_codon:yes gene_type:complete